MICDECNENEATFHYTEIINGNRRQRHLCPECAKKMGAPGYGGSMDNVTFIDPGNELAFVKLLTGLLSSSGSPFAEKDTPMAHIKCPRCKMSFEEFTRIGKFGCPECYDVFGPLIEDNMKKIQGSIEHKGKIYSKIHQSDVLTEKPDGEMENESLKKDDVNENIEILTAKLNEAVRLENFEDAAMYRDKIKALKEGNANA